MPFHGAGSAVSPPERAARSRSRSPAAAAPERGAEERRQPEFTAAPKSRGGGGPLSKASGEPGSAPEPPGAFSPAPAELEGEAVVRAKRAPHEPTPIEREDHAASNHAVYRSWCRACVAGRGKADPHTAQDIVSDDVPRVGIDYGYLEGKAGQGAEDPSASPILFSRSSKTQAVSADVLPSKGTGESWNVETLVSTIMAHGHTRLILKSDDEPAILDVKRAAMAIARARHGFDIMPESSPVGDHESNGLAEGAVRDVKAQCRTLRFAVEELHGIKVSPRHPILAWLVPFAAFIVNVGRRGIDGRTPHYRRRGQDYKRALPAFSERVSYQIASHAASRIGDRFGSGIFLGVVPRSSAFWIGVEDGSVTESRCLRRGAPSEHAAPELINSLRGVPWMLNPAEQERPQVSVHADPVVAPADLPPKPSEEQARKPRQLYIRKHVELKAYGYTVGCAGCDAVREDAPQSRPHTDACRARIVEAMEADGGASRRRVAEAFVRTLPTITAPTAEPTGLG